jgi:AcrR family transcriptional regulator
MKVSTPFQAAAEPKEGEAAPVRQPRRRRKDARPGEIIAAAIEIFGERGFGATKLEDVARRAGVAKGTLFVYFSSKEELFRAVAQTALTHLGKLRHLSNDLDRPLAELVPVLLAQAANLGDSGLPAVARLIIAEARIFPDLARVWHDEVVSKVMGLLTAAIERAQERGEIRTGDPKLYAFSILGPMMAATLFREVFAGIGASLPQLRELAEQHANAILYGLNTSVKNGSTPAASKAGRDEEAT